MREIKFRAWDDEAQKMYYPPNLHITMVMDGVVLNLQNGVILKPLLFTGLKDKNGVDIYSADKYRWLSWEVRNGKQIRPERIYIIRDDTPEHWIEDCYKLWCISTGNSKDTVEVIGNIYEHPLKPDTREKP